MVEDTGIGGAVALHLMRRGWNVALRTVACFFIGVTVMFGYTRAERKVR
jgi:hypothetical protein